MEGLYFGIIIVLAMALLILLYRYYDVKLWCDYLEDQLRERDKKMFGIRGGKRG